MMMDHSSPAAADSPALTTISEDPSVKESLITSLDSPITPTERFYVRNHFSVVPQIDAAAWRLKVGGLVRQPLELSFDELLSLPSRESVVTLECAGNSRSYLTPPAEGIGFSHGAVSTARWKGVPLALILERAGANKDALEVVFHGADTGEEEEDGVVYSTELPYARSLPLATAMRPELLLAYEMNDEPLTTDHGFPLRLLVPRWYGMASVKWLTRIKVVDKPFEGFFQKRRYVFIDEGVEDDPARKPVTTLKVKSIITAPRHGEVIQPGGLMTFVDSPGREWGKLRRWRSPPTAGRNWSEAKLLRSSEHNAWCQWEFPWTTKEQGHFIFMSRATDSAGNGQPKSVPWNFRGYANNAIHTLAVEVPARQGSSVRMPHKSVSMKTEAR